MLCRVLLCAAILWLKPQFIFADEPGNPQSPLQQMQNAQPRCPNGTFMKPFQWLLGQLRQETKETGSFTGIFDDGDLMVITTSPDWSTFTILKVNPGTKLACMIWGSSLQDIRQQGEQL